jgi:hypothetical protein
VGLRRPVRRDTAPLSREELEERRARQRENREKLAAKGTRKSSKGRAGSWKGLTIATLEEGRLSDLQLLLKLRGLDKLEGWVGSMRSIFLRGFEPTRGRLCRRRPGNLERTGKASQGDCLVQPSKKPHAQWIKQATHSRKPHSERNTS